MIVGIDLGTTYSAIAYINKDGKPEIIPSSEGGRTTPSAVMFEDGGNVIVGEIAKDNAIVDGCNVVEYIKNEMGNSNYKFRSEDGSEYTPEELSSFILKKLKIDAENFLGTEVENAVVTVPAYFTDAQRKSTQDAGTLAGLKVMKIINEPTAAAIAFGMSSRLDNCNILVYDLGGGTFDATIVHYNENNIEVRATDGIRRLGGHFFDQEIVNMIAELLQEKHGIDLYDDEHIDVLQELTKKAEECKIHLSARLETYIPVNCDGIKERIKITREQFNNLIRTLYERSERIVLNVLKSAGITWDDIGKVLLVGGSSRIPYIRERLREISGKEPSCEINPDEAVAIGAAIQGMIIGSSGETGSEPHVKIEDVCSHGIGLITVDARSLRRVNSVIIDRNTKVPAKSSRRFFTAEDDQEYIRLEVTEGEDTEVEYINIIGSFEIDIPRGLKKGTEVEIEMVLDENQIVHVYTRIIQAGGFFREIHISRKSNLSSQQLEKKKDLISKISVKQPQAERPRFDVQKPENNKSKTPEPGTQEILLPPDIAKEFDKFVGMESVKKYIISFINEARLDQKRRQELKLEINNVRGYHFMLVGNPGTGKTTVARVLSKALNSLGIRSADTLIEVDKSGVVGQYIGQTQVKVQELLTKASGGTLFVDEAYTLYKKDNEKDFGREALDALMKAMEDQRGSLTVILAGYKKQMNEMMEANVGLKSRINYIIEIPDYSDDELLQIADKMAEDMGLIITTQGRKAVRERINRERVDEKFGNARFIRDLLNEAYRNLANRLAGGSYLREAMMMLEAVDFGVNLDITPEQEIEKALSELRALTGLQGVKHQVESIVNSMRVHKEKVKLGIAEPGLNLGSMHMIFQGSPGTGKTTVARIIGRIYKALGILKRGDVFVECTRGDLVAGYSGQTAAKTQEVISKSLGGILFIDEAYSLVKDSNDSFGKEAVDTLIAEMENKRDKLMVILAGYKQDIEKLLEANAGFTSRINTTIDFEDYSIDELLQIFQNIAKGRNMTLSSGVSGRVREMIERKSRAKDFGNARGVRNIFEKIIIDQNNRIAGELLKGRQLGKEDFLTIIEEDIIE